MINKKLVGVLLILILGIVSTGVMAGEYWRFGEFNQDKELFKYKITTYQYERNNNEDNKEYEIKNKVVIFYELIITRKENDLVNISYQYQKDYTNEEFGSQDSSEKLMLLSSGNLANVGTVGWVSSNVIILSSQAENLELEVGSSMSTWTGGKIKISGKKRLAGVEGYVCDYLDVSKNKDGDRVSNKTMEWIINPEIGLPLCIKTYDPRMKKIIRSMELVNYEVK